MASMVDALKLAFLAELDIQPEAVPGAPAKTAAAVFLREALHVSGMTAARDVAAARAVASACPELPLMGQALADGVISREHLDVAVSTLRRLPQHLKTQTVQLPDDASPDPAEGETAGDQEDGRTGVEVIDELLVKQSRLFPPTTIDRLGRQIVHLLDPGRADRLDPDAVMRRHCSVGTDFTGMGLYRLTVDPATHAMLQAVLARWSAPHPPGTARDGDGETVTVTDKRTPGQRRADAMVACIMNGDARYPARSGDAPTPSADASDGDISADRENEATNDVDDPCAEDRPDTPFWSMAQPSRAVQVTVIATLEQLAAACGSSDLSDPSGRRVGLSRLSSAGTAGAFPGSTLAPGVLARLACDSVLYRILTDSRGAVLHHGRRQRYASPAQKRALAARDGGCVIPACGAPPEWTDAHHLTPWAEGGGTDIDNLVLMCGRHHTDHHAGLYPIEMREGVPWVRLPSWQDTSRPWLRNTTAQHHRLAAEVAALLLGPTGPTGPPDPTGSADRTVPPEQHRPPTGHPQG